MKPELRAMGADGRGGVWCSGLLGVNRLQRDLESECFELRGQSLGSMFGAEPPRCPVRAELSVGNAVVNDVPVGDDDVVPGGTERFVASCPSLDLHVMRGQVRVLGLDRAPGRLGQRDLEPLGSGPAAASL